MRLIDADALLIDIENTIKESGCVNHENEIMDCVEYAPTTDTKPSIHAVWVGNWECSNCGYCANAEHSDWQYCPNCGAKISNWRIVKGKL